MTIGLTGTESHPIFVWLKTRRFLILQNLLSKSTLKQNDKLIFFISWNQSIGNHLQVKCSIQYLYRNLKKRSLYIFILILKNYMQHDRVYISTFQFTPNNLYLKARGKTIVRQIYKQTNEVGHQTCISSCSYWEFWKYENISAEPIYKPVKCPEGPRVLKY